MLKNKPGAYIRIAASGETVLVIGGDRLVAELGPPRPGRGPTVSDAFLAEGVRAGWLSPATVVSAGPPPRKPVMKLRDLLEELKRDRADR